MVILSSQAFRGKLFVGVMMLVLCVYTRVTLGIKENHTIQDSIMLMVRTLDDIMPAFNSYVAEKKHRNAALVTYLPQPNR